MKFYVIQTLSIKRLFFLVFYFISFLDACQNSPCKGLCVLESSLESGFKCVCQNGYSGIACDQRLYSFLKFSHNYRGILCFKKRTWFLEE